MRLSRYFLPVLRETPKEAEIVSHQLMLRAGMVRQAAAGIYSWLPLGFRVLKKIEQIVREEQNRAGAIEVLMPTIQSADLWRESGRYDAYGKEMLRIKDRHEREMLYGPTNEELITAIFRDGVKSYKDLPRNLYHIQWKFRDEVRPRFGVMRGREFLMKDAYSFDLTPEAGARCPTTRMFVAYLRTFARMGLKVDPDGGRHRPDRRRPQPRVHHPGRDRREPGLLPQGPDRRRGAAGRHRFRRRPDADHQALDVALRGDRREARRGALRRRGAGGQAGVRARHRGRPHLLLRHQVFRADGLQGAGTGRADRSRCRWAPTASACRGSSARSSRRATTTPASSGRCRWRRSRSA